MQTFLPFSNFDDSARTLDLKRLGKQIMESGQIMRALTVPSYGWKNHPATKMWAGHEGSLLLYTADIADEWKHRRGKEHGAWTRIVSEFGKHGTIKPFIDFISEGRHQPPAWLGDKDFHISHQSNLVRKEPDHYREFFPDVPDDLEYVWPV